MNPNRYFYVLAALLAPLAALYVLYAARSMLPPVLCGLLGAYILFPVVRKTDTLGIPRWLVIIGLLLAITGTIVFAVYSFLPDVKNEVTAVVRTVDSHGQDNRQSHLLTVTAKVSKSLANIGAMDKPLTEAEAATLISESIQERSQVMVEAVGGWARQIGQFLMVFAFVFVFSLLDGEKFYRAVISFIPNSFLEPGIFIFHKSSEMMGQYIRGLVVENLLLSFIAMVMLFVIALIPSIPLSLPLALAIAAIIGLTNVVRIVGPLIGGAIGIVIALAATADIWTALAVAIVAVIVQLADNLIILPLIMKDQINIHPVISFLGVLAGGFVGGILGMILAIPVIGGIKVVHRVMTIEMKQVAAA